MLTLKDLKPPTVSVEAMAQGMTILGHLFALVEEEAKLAVAYRAAPDGEAKALDGKLREATRVRVEQWNTAADSLVWALIQKMEEDNAVSGNQAQPVGVGDKGLAV